MAASTPNIGAQQGNFQGSGIKKPAIGAWQASSAAVVSGGSKAGTLALMGVGI